MSKLRNSVWTRKINPTDFDFDLFFKSYICDFFIHLASAGGSIDTNIIASPVHFALRQKLRRIPETLKLEYKLSPHIDEILREKAIATQDQEFDREAYLSDFIEFARCGCFSFDRTHLSDPTDNRYHLVAYPIFRQEYGEIIGIIEDGFVDNLSDRFDMNILNAGIDKFVKECLGKGIVSLDEGCLAIQIERLSQKLFVAKSIE